MILGTTLSGVIRDGVKAIPQALEMTGKLGGQAFNGVLNLADAGARQAMRKWDGMRQEQLKPSAPPTRKDLDKGTIPLSSGAETQGFKNDWPKTGGLNQSGTSPLGGKAPRTSRINGNGKATTKF